MKFLAFILSFYLLTISSQPVLVALMKPTEKCEMPCCRNKQMQHSCTSKDKSCPAQKQENSCPLCCCNLMQCAFCLGAIVDEIQFKINLPSKSAVAFASADSNLHSSYSSDCWQPPELS